MALDLNRRASELCDRAAADAVQLAIAVERRADGGMTLDFGVSAAGSLEAGRRLAEICLAGLAEVSLAPAPQDAGQGLAVLVRTDHPVAACMASQYAGWQVTGNGFFGMGSGPMRAAAAKEDLFRDIGLVERPDVAVGVLEANSLLPLEVVAELARQCGVEPARLTLAVAPTASPAGTVQIVARSVETALHKLHELGFDLGRVQSGAGLAPLPPVAANDLEGIGWTNDAILYGGDVSLTVRGDDASLAAIGPQVPSCASADHGQPFAALFERYGRDFYQIDKHLFSPAVINFINLDTGRTHRFGHKRPDLLARSFGA
jgi:methenyltetrahydromethanopterin cyclohydrolase